MSTVPGEGHQGPTPHHGHFDEVMQEPGYRTRIPALLEGPVPLADTMEVIDAILKIEMRKSSMRHTTAGLCFVTFNRWPPRSGMTGLAFGSERAVCHVAAAKSSAGRD